MADATSRRALKEIRSTCGNNICFECGKLNPQWVSVTYGIWVCVECSGKHRLLGLHLSQIKSITMDKWTEKEVQKVRAGGNSNFKEFLEAHDDYVAEWTIEEKYNSMLAALYRDKVTIEATGEIWIEEESPIFINSKPTTKSSDTISSQLSEISLTDANDPTEQRIPRDAKPAEVKVVEVEAEEELDTFSRLGQGLSLASGFMKSTAEMAKAELSEFKEQNESLDKTKQNISNTLSSWSCWASNTLNKVSDTLVDGLSNGDEKKEEVPQSSFWSGFGQKRPPPMCMSVQTISDNEE
ncbi:Oidioi.mRNA.OKI2018_I69.PAR.g12854.t2.cds [Oikopleura dioica]|uniref:Oidioi.mRNA.OKI2018_I69.PAR.g12854.t2.cds n=1 Tax=Oikopleura dioica TaxID=34765 RepID=A0ABN7S569_OIKDI|nr:Oidioi.mRNA.OKI2018_I69.PAR.g12854.t2.cds [Oikopleura dioica]